EETITLKTRRRMWRGMSVELVVDEPRLDEPARLRGWVERCWKLGRRSYALRVWLAPYGPELGLNPPEVKRLMRAMARRVAKPKPAG
ncbi:MAG TPA: hypothetical protein P5137_03510, partial [Candidatus Brocadiia bacterium]|nr:hypothetical protein [Candidatus Brocadiia bacterium]